jgi:DNA-binding transcriptional LysR family regulator
VRIRLVGQNSAETAEDVRNGRLEAGLVSLPVPGEDDLEVLPVIQDEVVYVSADPSRVARPPSIEDLADRQLVLYDAHHAASDPMRRQLAERAQRAGLHLDPVVEVEYLASALDLVAAGVGDSFAPGGAVTNEVRDRGLHTTPLAEPLFDTVALVRRRRHPLSPATTEFVLLAHDALRRGHKRPGATTTPSQGTRTIRDFLATN